MPNLPLLFPFVLINLLHFSDSGVNGDVSLAITGGTGSAYLTINAATGEVTTTAAIDYEVLPVRKIFMSLEHFSWISAIYMLYLICLILIFMGQICKHLLKKPVGYNQ